MIDYQELNEKVSGKVLPDYLKPVGDKVEENIQTNICPDYNCPGDICPGNVSEKQGFIIKTPNLKKLCIIDLFIYHGLMYLTSYKSPCQIFVVLICLEQNTGKI